MSTRLSLTILLLTLAIFTCAQAELTATDYGTISKSFGFDEFEIIKFNQSIFVLAVNDFNNDHLNDIAVMNNHNSRIDMLLQNSESGEETTEKVVTDKNDIDINELSENRKYKKDKLYVNMKMYSLVSGDFNSDGLADLAFYGEPRGLYIVLQKKSSDSSLAWKEPQKIKINDGLKYSVSLICNDIDGDGRDDLILAAKTAAYIIYQQQDKQMSKPVKSPYSDKVLWLFVNDINNDGKNDLIVITNQHQNNLNIQLNKGSRQFGPIEQFTVANPAYAGFYSDKEKQYLLIAESQNGRITGYQYLPNSQEQTSQLTMTIFPLDFSDQSYKRNLITGDFDGDSLEDIVVTLPASAQVCYYKQKDNDKLNSPQKFPSYSDITSIFTANLDDDIADELIVLSVSEKTVGVSNYNNNKFDFPQTINLPGEPIGIVPAMIDSNSSVDCFYLYRDANDNRILDIVYDFANEKQRLANLKLKMEDVQSTPEGMKAIDADHDGLTDVIIFTSQYSSPILIKQTSKGKFEISNSDKTSLLEKAQLSSTHIANIDNTPGEELLIAYGNYARSIVLKDDLWQVIDQYNAKDIQSNIDCAILYDLDKDGENEILLFDGQKANVQMLKADNNIFRFSRDFDIGKWQLKKVAVLKHKNSKALILFDGKKFAIASLTKTSPTVENVFSYETKIKNGKYAKITVGDLNNDDIKDISLVDRKNNNIEILTLDKNSKPFAAFRFKVFQEKSYQRDNKSLVEPRALKIADVTGDGLNDLIVIVHDRVIVYPQDK